MTTKLFTRRAITLVEMLVAMAITLVMMAAVVTLFDQMGRGVNDSRATIEMAARLRGAQQVLQSDLGGLTCPTRPWNHPEAGAGYFEFVEGPHSDMLPTTITLNPGISLIPTNVRGNYNPADGPSGLGDYDDILMFTIRSRGEPFVGRVLDGSGAVTTIESNIAEVVWYAVENPDVPQGDRRYLGEPGLRTIYRRVLLVAPWMATALATAPIEDLSFFQDYDVSSRLEDQGAGVVRVPNSLSDLAKRECRFAHQYTDDPRHPNLVGKFPYRVRNNVHYTSEPDAHIFVDEFGVPPAPANPLRPFGQPFHPTDARKGEDVVLTNVLGFDVLAYDPEAPVYSVNGVTVGPGDPGWQYQPGLGTRGSYVNLGYSRSSPSISIFAESNPHFRPVVDSLGSALTTVDRSAAGFSSSTFDTWPFHYEQDGIDQDDDGMVDEGTNGFDDDGRNGVDDPGERETSPPYDAPLRGIQIRIRVYEPTSRQVREVSIHQSFVPD